MAAGIDHPNIVPIYQAGETDGLLFIAMRYMRGSGLKRLIERDGRLDPSRAASVVRQAASALDAAHDQGLVHRDVKPANLLLAPGPDPEQPDQVYLSDFGLTKRPTSRSGLTNTGQFTRAPTTGTPESHPARARSSRRDRRCDRQGHGQGPGPAIPNLSGPGRRNSDRADRGRRVRLAGALRSASKHAGLEAGSGQTQNARVGGRRHLGGVDRLGGHPGQPAGERPLTRCPWRLIDPHRSGPYRSPNEPRRSPRGPSGTVLRHAGGRNGLGNGPGWVAQDQPDHERGGCNHSGALLPPGHPGGTSTPSANDSPRSIHSGTR